MSKQGTWIKTRKDPEYTREGLEAVKPQRDLITVAGEKLKKKCTGKKGDEFKRCRTKVFDKVFGKPKSDEVEEPSE